MEAIINTRLKLCITFHEFFHRLHAGKGMRAAILDIKLSQDLYIIDQYPLFLVLLDLYKSYDTLDREGLLTILEGYGTGPHMCGILTEF